VTSTLDDAPFLNMFSEEFRADPGPVIEALRKESWLVRTPIGALAIGRRQVQALLADRRLRSSIPDIVRLQGVTEGPLYDRLISSDIALAGEDHVRVRKLVSRAFTPRAIDAHRAQMRDTLQPLLAPLGGGHCEFMGAVADHYPIQVMCHLLGVPDEDHGDFARWNRAITWALSFQLSEHRADVEWGMSKMEAYVADLMADRRRQPRDDLVTALVQAEEDNDRLTDTEVQTMIAALLFAGYDTTRNQLGLGIWLFAQHPDQWQHLAADPSLAPAAVEEIMRFRGAVSVAPRMVAEDFDVDGYHLPAGTLLALSTAAANHDPSAYEDPTSFDITVEREAHFTFGGGPHYCLGASLARAEMQEALPILVAQMPELALDGEPTWRPPLGIFGPETLPIRFAPRRG